MGAGTAPEKTQEDGQKIPNFHPKFPPESFGTLIDRCALKNLSYFWWSHADSMESNPVLSRKIIRKVLGCQRDPGPLIEIQIAPQVPKQNKKTKNMKTKRSRRTKQNQITRSNRSESTASTLTQKRHQCSQASLPGCKK